MQVLKSPLFRNLITFLELGARKADADELRRIRILNLFSFSTVLISTPFTVLFFFDGVYFAAVINMIYLVNILAVPFLNRYGPNVSILYFGITIATSLLAIAYLIGTNIGVLLFFFEFSVSLLIARSFLLNSFLILLGFICFSAGYVVFDEQVVQLSIPHNWIQVWVASAVFVQLSFSVAYALYQMRRAEAETERQRQRSDRLLANILPEPVASRLKSKPRSLIADRFAAVTILFADIVGFTPRARGMRPEDVVNFLNHIFTLFDGLSEKYAVEKIKTIGDAYMVAAGLPKERKDHVEAAADMGIEMLEVVADLRAEFAGKVEIRIGIHTGPVVAGVIGTHKFAYDIWGDTVNTAARMESHGVPGRIQVTAEVRDALAEAFTLKRRGLVDVKGVGPIETFFLVGRRSGAKHSV